MGIAPRFIDQRDRFERSSCPPRWRKQYCHLPGGQFSAIYDRAATSGQQQSGPLNGSMQSSLSQTPYYGSAQTDQQLYSNDQPIIISGQALDRITGLPVASVPLKIGFCHARLSLVPRM